MVCGIPTLAVTFRYPNTLIIRKIIVWICYRHRLSHFESQRHASVWRARNITLVEVMNSIPVSGTSHGHHSEFHRLSN